MPPKAKAAASNGGEVNDAQRSKDAAVIFDALFDIASPVVINVGEIARKSGDKVNTVAKRFTLIKKRYPELKIQTTSKVDASNGIGSPSTTVPPTPSRNKPITNTAKPTPRKNNKSKANKDDDEDEDVDVNAPATTSYNGAEEDQSDKDIKTSAKAKIPSTPNDTHTDTNLADDEDTIKKPARATKTKAKGTSAAAEKKRKAAEGSPTPTPETKKRKVGRPKKAINAKNGSKEANNEDVAEADDQDGKEPAPDADEEVKQEGDEADELQD